MEDQLIDSLSKIFNTPSNQIQIEEVKRSPFQLAHSQNKIFWVTIKKSVRKLFLALHPVDKPNIWYLKKLKTSVEILNSLRLKYSTHPDIVAYFRTTYEEELYDAVLMEKGSGILIQNLFHPDKLDQLKTALFAFGRGLAELHLKKLRPNGKPSKKYDKLINSWLGPCLDDYEYIHSPLSKECCLDMIDRLRKEADKLPFHIGVVYYDPHPNNLMYNPHTDKLILLDIDLIAYSVNKKGESAGPIELDYARATYDIKKSLAVMDLPDDLIEAFDTPYRRFMGNSTPNTAQVDYFQFILHIKSLWLGRKLKAPSDIQIKIIEHARRELQEMINR